MILAASDELLVVTADCNPSILVAAEALFVVTEFVNDTTDDARLADAAV